MPSKSGNLIILSDSFPYGNMEPYLKNELPYLSGSFDQIIFLVQTDIISALYPTPPSVKTQSYSIDTLPYKKGTLIKLLFQKKSIKELLGILFLFKIFEFKVYWKELLKAAKIAMLIDTTIKKYNCPPESTILYSFWSDAKAIGATLAKQSLQGLKVVTRLHGYDLYKERHPKNYLPLRNWLYTKIDFLFPISDFGKEYLVKYYPVSPNKISVERLGTNNNHPFSMPQKREKLSIVSCAHIVPLKRVDLLIESLSKLDIEWEWTHIGSGELLEKTKELAQNNLVSKEFTFTGDMENDHIQEWYQTNKPDVFINLSSTEGIPVAIMEAMSFGIPVIATDAGGTSEVVNSSNGFLLPVNINAALIADKILEFNNLPDSNREKMCIAARKTWEEKYSAKTNYTKFAENLSSLINSQ